MGSGVEGSSLRDQVLNINEVAAFGMTFIQPSTDLNIDYIWPCSDLDIGGSCILRQLKLFMNTFFRNTIHLFIICIIATEFQISKNSSL